MALLQPFTPLPVQAAQTISKSTAGAALIMIEEPGCPYCERWRQEVGVGYANSAEGRFAPLQRYEIGSTAARRFQRVTYSPTFIVVADGRELGRIVGYPGADFFWPMLEGILRSGGFKPE